MTRVCRSLIASQALKAKLFILGRCRETPRSYGQAPRSKPALVHRVQRRHQHAYTAHAARLLHVRGERQCCRAAQQSNEVAPSHSRPS
jgi:hypothetical protein